jgi:small-conductance mechanosensitive channel
MFDHILRLIHRLGSYAVPLGIVAGALVCGYLMRTVVFGLLARWSRKTRTHIDDIVISSVRGVVVLLFLILGIYIAVETGKFPQRAVHAVERLLTILVIVSVTIMLANIVTKLIQTYESKVEAALPVTSLTRNIARIVIFVIGFLILMDALGISITPILATLGVGGLAVALALQDTLANLFAGFHITVAKQIRVGDFIKLENGQEGYVTDINWRTTKIKMLPNNVVLIPNQQLSKSIVTNYYLPAKDMAVLVEVGVHYSSDLEVVERVTKEVAASVMKEIDGGVVDFQPFIRYHTFNQSSIDFTVILRAREVTDQYLIKHEFIKRLQARYRQEGIVIPYPIRAINYAQEKE